MTEEKRNIQSSDPATGKRWPAVMLIPIVLKTLAIVASCVGLWLYVDYRSPRSIGYATEQRDGSENRVVKTNKTRIGENFTLFKTNQPAASFAAAWPCFRGKNRDNLVRDTQPLSKSWDDSGPKVLWRADLGEGYAGAIIAENRVYVLDYWEEKNADALRCFDLLSGTELWRRSYKNPIRRNHGKSRTVPAYADNVVVSLGPAGHVMAVDARSGDLLWSCDLVATYKCEVPQWYAGQCPLIDGQKVILGIGGEKVLVAAFDLKNGNTVWELPNDGAFKMSHASILSAKLLNRDCYVYAALGGIAACDHDGKPLWRSTVWKPAVWAPTPVALDDHRLFLTAGYGAGSAILSLQETGGQITATLDKQWKPTQGPASEQQTPLLIDGTLFTIQPKDAGALRAELVAANADTLPAVTASSGKENRFGLGPYLFADNAFWIVDDDGVLHVFGFEGKTFTRLARHKVLPGVDAWGPIALAGGLMILRDSKSLACLDLRKERTP